VNFSTPRAVLLCVGTLRDGAKQSRSAGDRDEAVVRAVYAEHGAALLRYARRLTGDRGHAEDLVQNRLVGVEVVTDRGVRLVSIPLSSG